MIGYVRQIAPEELENFRRNPETVREFLQNESLSRFPPSVRPAYQRLPKLIWPWNAAERRRLGALIEQEMNKPGAKDMLLQHHPDELCLDKSWHSLHFLLTGRSAHAPPPLGNAILGGREIGRDLGYGPARFLTPEEVRDVAAALGRLSRDVLKERFSAERKGDAEIYCPCDDEDDLKDLLQYFDELSQHYADAAARGNAMLLYIR